MVGLRVLFTQKTYGRSGLPPNSVPKVVHNYAVCNGHLFGDENLTFFLSHLGHFFFFFPLKTACECYGTLYINTRLLFLPIIDLYFIDALEYVVKFICSFLSSTVNTLI